MKMPTGFRFRPSEEELINYYLKPKNLGQTLPCNIVQEKPLYSGDPWRVLDVRNQENKWQVSETHSGIPTKMTIYVFTKLTKKKHVGAGGRKKEAVGGGGREHFVRAAGCGTWDGQTGAKKIKNGGEVIRFKKNFVFEIGSFNSSTSSSGSEWEYVLCEITLKISKKSKSFENLEEIGVRKSSSPRVEFGTANSEGDVGVNYYMEAVTHSVEVSIPESSSRIEGGCNIGEGGAGCNYMEIVPQPIDNELMLMIEELGGDQIQQPLAAFEYVNGGQYYQANDEQWTMIQNQQWDGLLSMKN